MSIYDDRAWRLGSFGVASLALVWAILDIPLMGRFFPFGDTLSYWHAWHGLMYDPASALAVPHFIYAPAFALVLWPLAQLPAAVFAGAWTVLAVSVYAWLLAPLPLTSRLPAMVAALLFALNGNIEWALAFTVVSGMRWPSLWLAALFTKIAPFVGFIWFLVHRNWAAIAQTFVVGAALVVASALLLPGAWMTWLAMVQRLATETDVPQTLNPLMPPIPFAVRLVGAIAVGWWGARRDTPIALPVAVALCQPDWQPWAFGILAAVPRLRLFRLPNQQAKTLQ